MANYVLVTDECQDDARRHGEADVVAGLARSVEETDSLPGFDFFFPTAFIKRSLGRSFRLLAYQVPKGEDDVVLFLRVMARGSKEYEQFLAKWDAATTDAERQFVHVEAAAVDAFYRGRKRTSPPPRRPVPNDEQMMWLYQVFAQHGDDTGELEVLESASWVQSVKQPGTRDLLALYHKLLKDLDITALAASASNTDCHALWKDDAGVGFVYVYRADMNKLALLEPLTAEADAASTLESTITRLSRVGPEGDDLARIAARCYPYLMVLDRDSWLAIQKDDEANLALSPEEARLLFALRFREARLRLFERDGRFPNRLFDQFPERRAHI